MRIISLLVILCLCFTSCATTSGTATVNPAGAEFLRTGTSVVAYEGLKNNPRYAPGAQALVAAIDVALSGSAIITEQTVADFVAKVAAQNHLDPVEALFFSGIARTAFQAYAAKFDVKTGVLITDPNAKLYVTAFRNGLSDALTMLPK